MPNGWVAVPDETGLDRVAAALDDPTRSGAMLAGPDGVGTTTTARLAAARFVARRPSAVVRWVTATAPERLLPFGAFDRLVDVAAPERPAELLRAAQDCLIGGADDVLLVVDDAHHLDSLSATLVYQLALSGSVRLLVTVRAEAALPEAVTALCADDLLDGIDVGPLDKARTTAVLASVADLSPAALDELYRRSRGNPLYLRLLVEGGAVDGGPVNTAASLSGLVDGYLSGLSAPVRAVLDHLAVAEPLRREDLAALAGDQALAGARAAAAIRADDDMVYAAHPLYSQRARAALNAERARALRTAVVGQLSRRPADHVGDALRLGMLSVDTDAPVQAGELEAAAQQALRLGGLTLAEELARAALQRSGGLAARLALAYALAWQGRGRGAGAALAAVDPDDLSETELLAWALPRAANQFWILDEPERATAFLQAIRGRLAAPASQTRIDALAATFAMNAGTPLRALRITGEVLTLPHADEVAVGWAASTAALSAARTGAFDDVEALAARALAGEHPGLLRFTSGFGRVTALMMAGRLAEARSVAQRYTDFAELQQPGRAIGDTLVGYVAIAQGDFDAAVTLLERAADPLARTGYSWGPLSLMLLAQALGQQGDQLRAAKVFGRAESRHGLKSALFGPELELARAWSKAARGDTTGAIDAARMAVQAAERGGQSAIALRALQDSARLGDTRAVFRAERLSVEVDCVLGRLTVAHARALAAADPAALADVAADLADRGLNPAARDAAAQAERGQPVR
ncbi:AAA family ATPase [Mycobacterium sp.]|uniref:AAA family ATPase n=1 Tax=Mycobacterium sp. TaxID=1785 RepID=UPI0031DC333E